MSMLRAIETLLAIFMLCSSGTAWAATRQFGILYEPWHCLVKGHEVRDISQYLAGKQQLGPAPEFHWWGKPTAGYYCLSDNDDVLRRHAELLAKAGIDFVAIDFSNHDKRSDPTVDLEYLSPLQRLLKVWSRIPNAPKVVPFVQVTPTGDLHDEIIGRLSQFPEMMFKFHGKPLILIVPPPAAPVDADKRARLDRDFTTRSMWSSASGSDWYFLSPCQNGFLQSEAKIDCKQKVGGKDGIVEEIPVAAAYQRDYMSDLATATPRFHGATLSKQMARLDDFPDAPIVMILGWNQWIAQRLCARFDLRPDPACDHGGSPLVNGNPVFTDEFNQEYSNDLEPGGDVGDAYYRLLAREVNRRKASEPTEGAGRHMP